MEAKKAEGGSDKNEIKTYLMPLSGASKISGYTVEHLNLLCRKKVLKGMKVGRNWHTTREWLNEFLFLPKKGTEGKEYKIRKKGKRRKAIFISGAESNLFSEMSKNQAEDSFLKARAKENIPGVKADSSVEPEGGKFSWPKTIAISFSTLLITLLLFFGISFWKFLDTRNSLIERGIPTNLSEDTFLLNGKPGVVEGETTTANNTETLPTGAASSSENYKMEQVSFGGADITLASMDNEPLEISDIKSETFNSKDGKEAQLLISWKTNKLSISEISYFKDSGENPKTLQEKYYGFNHNAVLTKLDMAATYNYEIKTKDRWGNEISSEKFRAYTGSKVVSVFDLIVKAASDTFGWAVKK